MESGPAFSLSKTYLYKLRRATNKLDQLLDKILRAKASLTLAQFALLATVMEHHAINQRKVAQFLGISPAAIKRQTDLALQAGWLEIAQQQNGPGQALHLTHQGHAMLQKGLEALSTTLSEVFAESDRQANLMTHINLLLSSTKGVVNKQQPDTKPINRKGRSMSVRIPKARQLYRGDINAAVIAVQKMTGFEIDPRWWTNNVGDNGTSEEILDRFDKAYERDFGAKIAAAQAPKGS